MAKKKELSAKDIATRGGKATLREIWEPNTSLS